MLPRPGAVADGRPLRRVLVGWDGSADAAAALGAAAAVVGREGGHIVALTVLTEQPRAEARDQDEDDRAAIRRTAEEQFDRLRSQQALAAGVRLSVQVVAADRAGAARAVCDYAAVHGFDLLVLGKHGEGGVRPGRLGRVADGAAHACRIPLLLLSAQ